MPQYRLASYIRSNHHRIPYTSEISFLKFLEILDLRFNRHLSIINHRVFSNYTENTVYFFVIYFVYIGLAAESIKRNSAWNIISSGLEFDSRKTRTRQMPRQQYYGDYHQQSCCGGSHNGSSDILKPVLFSFLLPLAIGLSLALLWLLLQSVRVGTIAFLQQQQQGQQQQGQQSSNNNLNVNNNNHDTISISITNTATG